MTTPHDVRPLEWLRRLLMASPASASRYAHQTAGELDLRWVGLPLSLPRLGGAATPGGVRCVFTRNDTTRNDKLYSAAHVLELTRREGVTHCIAVETSHLERHNAKRYWRERLTLFQPPRAPGHPPRLLLALENSGNTRIVSFASHSAVQEHCLKEPTVAGILDDVLLHCTTHHIFTTTELTP